MHNSGASRAGREVMSDEYEPAIPQPSSPAKQASSIPRASQLDGIESCGYGSPHARGMTVFARQHVTPNAISTAPLHC